MADADAAQRASVQTTHTMLELTNEVRSMRQEITDLKQQLQQAPHATAITAVLTLADATRSGKSAVVRDPQHLMGRAESGAFCDGGHKSLVADFMWVGVLRMAPGTIGHCDGHCPGSVMNEAHSRAYDAIIPNSSKWPKVNYGCWFYTALDASDHSGAFVNVGRSLRLETRCDVHDVLYKSRKASNALCTGSPGDRLWCTLARAQGYDSIQIQKGVSYYDHSAKRRPWGEMIHCGDECARETFSDSACVPVAVAKNNTPCRCPPGASQLSCRGERLAPGWPASVKRTSTRQPARCHAVPSFDHLGLLRADDYRHAELRKNGRNSSRTKTS